MNLIRLLIALVFLCGLAWLVRGRPLPADASSRAWIYLAASGLVGFTVADLCLFRAFIIIGARLTLLIFTLVPPLAALLDWIVLGERLRPVEWIGMALTVAGVGWVILARQPDRAGRVSRPAFAGVLLGIGGALGQAVASTLADLGLETYDPIPGTQIRAIAGTLGFAALFAAVGWWPRVLAAFRDRVAIACTGLGAFFGPCLGVSLLLYALKHGKNGVVWTIVMLVPVLIIPPSVWFFRERVTARAVLGALVAVTGAAICSLWGQPAIPG